VNDIALPDDWRPLVAEWTQNMSSQRSQRVYLQAWQRFIAWSGLHPSQVTKQDVMDWRDAMKEKGLSASTINWRLSAMSSLYRLAIEKGACSENPVDGVRRPKVREFSGVRPLAPGDDQRLVQSISVQTEKGLRDRAIVLIMLTRGLRVNEVAELRIEDISLLGADQSGRSIMRMKHIEKGHGDKRSITVPPNTAAAIEAYLDSRGWPKAGHLFVATEAGRIGAARLGRSVEGKGLTARAIHAMIKSRCDKLFGKGSGYHPHSLRHTAASNADDAGMGIGEISSLLGHASTRITSRYVHALHTTGDKAAAALDARYGQ
jgi:site-specific recombinase XerD